MSNQPHPRPRRIWPLATFLLLLLAVPALAGFWFGPGSLVFFTNTDPTTGGGVHAPVFTLLVRTDSPNLYAHTGNGDNDWTLLTTASGGTVTNVTGTAPIQVATGATTPAITFDPVLGAGSTKYIEVNFCEAAAGGNNFGYTASGTGAIHGTSTVMTAGHPCIDDMDTGTTSSGRVSFGTNPSLVLGSTAAGVIEWEADVSIPTLSTSTDEFEDSIGMNSVQTTTINGNAKMTFEYDRPNSATAPTTGAGNTSNLNNWICRTGDAGVYTEYVMDGTVVSDAGFTTVAEPIVAGSWYKLRIIYNQTPGEADFYVAKDGGAFTLACKITTHIPSTTQGTTHQVAPIAVYHIKSAGTNNRHMSVDYTWFYNHGLAR